MLYIINFVTATDNVTGDHLPSNPYESRAQTVKDIGTYLTVEDSEGYSCDRHQQL